MNGAVRLGGAAEDRPAGSGTVDIGDTPATSTPATRFDASTNLSTVNARWGTPQFRRLVESPTGPILQEVRNSAGNSEFGTPI